MMAVSANERLMGAGIFARPHRKLGGALRQYVACPLRPLESRNAGVAIAAAAAADVHGDAKLRRACSTGR